MHVLICTRVVQIGTRVREIKYPRWFVKTKYLSAGGTLIQLLMVMDDRPVDPGSIQGSHRPISFIRIKHRTCADDILCKTEY